MVVNYLRCVSTDRYVFGRKSVETDAAVWIGLAVRSDESGLGGLEQARLTVAQCAICLADKRDEKQVAEPAKDQVLEVRQRRSRHRVAEDDAQRAGAH